MNYRQLQKVLKRYKKEGLTDIAINSNKAVLQAELDRLRRSFGKRIEPMLSKSETEVIDINNSETIEQFFDEAKQAIQVTNEPIFPKKRKGLIHSTVNLLQCTCIMAGRIVVPCPRIPVIHIPRAYQSAMSS